MLTVIDTRSRCYKMASFTQRILVLFVLAPELREIVVFDNKRKKILRRIKAKLFIKHSQENSANPPYYKMFRLSQSAVPHLMTFAKGHLHLKFFCLVKMRKIIDMSLTDLYLKSSVANLSSMSLEDIAFDSE